MPEVLEICASPDCVVNVFSVNTTPEGACRIKFFDRIGFCWMRLFVLKTKKKNGRERRDIIFLKKK
jgi:hypothetical protein